jgi:4-hydroxy-tetrahydrodipicolinate reductase
MTTINIAIAGSGGRMGRALIDAVLHAKDLQLAAALEHPQSPLIGKDAGELVGAPCGVKVRADAAAALAGAQVLIDFTRPEGTLEHLAVCRRHGVKMVIGTTGFEDAGKQAIAAAARELSIVFAPNMSVGTNVVFKLLDVAARALKDGYDIEIIEAHHRHKVDAPSGTALRMGEIVAAATGRDLKKNGVFVREGVTGERDPDAIGFATVRGGDIVGDHTVLFAGTGERVEVSVKAGSRATYAEGALRAARFLMTKKAGLFDMHDVLGLR